MDKLSIIISTYENKNQLENCLNSINKQSLNNIDLLIISNNDLPIKNKNFKIYHSIYDAINNINSKYVLFIDETEFLKKDACELMCKQAKNENLDMLYIPITDNHIEPKKLKLNENQLISPFKFALFCKKKILENISSNEYSYYKIQKNAKNTKIIKQKIFFRNYISPKNLEKFSKEFLIRYPHKQDLLFSILMEYLIQYPVNLKQYVYKTIKHEFKLNSLNKNNQKIYELIIKKNNFIDFLTDYNLSILDYEIYENNYSKRDNYKISVIIPIFNKEILIHRTLMSIENQSLKIENIEVLMINDASTDNTKNVINRYVDKYPNFKAIHIKKRTGSSGTPRNIGLKIAKGDYVIFLDHDDFFEIDALEKLYDKITEYNCDIVYGTYVLINSKESIKFTYPNEKHGFFNNLEDNKRSIVIPPSIWTKLFKKEFLLNNNILFPTILGEDAIFMAKALKNAKGVYYLWEDIICYYNLNENSYSTTLPYNYFVEGFASETYLYELFKEWKHIDYYKIRGQGILDFYLNRLLESNLSTTDLNELFPILYIFCNRLNKLNVKPNLKNNKTAFKFIVNNDLQEFIKFKNYKPTKLKIISNKLMNKINKILDFGE